MPRRGQVVEQAVRSVCEWLEGRMLLTTISGGGVDPVTGEPIVNQEFYLDSNNHVAVISVGGNTTAEFLFARVPMQAGFIASLGDLTPPPPPGVQAEGKDLYNIYVAQSDSRSFISVSEIDPITGNLIPFAASAGQLRVRNAINGQSTLVGLDDGTGELVLGTRTKSPAPGDNIPIVSRFFAGAFGARPDLGRVTAGFEVAPGHDFGKFFFGGTIMGHIVVPGSIGNIYAGNIVTGDARGVLLGTQVISRGKRVPNFFVGGDVHSVLVSGSIGTNSDAGLDRPVFSSGLDMQVGGVLGEFNARDAVMGGVNVVHARAISPFGNTIEEVEGRNLQSGAPNTTAGWTTGHLEGNAAVFNDTFATPQILPSYAGKKHRSSVVVDGQLEADGVSLDFVDYYAMPMLAGQDLTVTLRPLGTIAGVDQMNVGVFDPDGRLILTDYPNVNFLNQQVTAVTGQPVHFTADRPGLYRIAVSATGDPNFAGGGVPIGNSPYVLTINGGGDLALGGIAAGNQIFDAQTGGYGFFVQNGDMGALQAGGNILSVTDQSINVRKGNLRSIEGGDVGVLRGALLSASPNLFVTRGNVGLVRSTAGIILLNEGVLPLAIGGDYQVVSAATTLGAELITNRAIGVIRAGNIATTNFASNFVVNADLTGDDGVIDLIDVAGDLGSISAGGPSITTGPGGNVRYINVGGQVFRDQFFGGNAAETTTYQPGESVKNLVDDSGTRLDFEPFPLVPNPLFIPGGTNPAQIGPTLTIRAYPIRGSGGEAIIDVTSTGSVRVGAGAGVGSKAHAEIGLIRSTGIGNPVIRSTNDGSLVFSSPTAGTAAANLDVLIDGSATVDVYKIQGSDFTSIRNKTPGEILNVDATANPVQPPGFTNSGTIGSLSATNIGVGVKHTAAEVNGIQVIGNNYPFNQQHNGIVSGNILNVQASGAVGNLNVSGNIGSVTANAGGRHSTGRFEGIAGPIVASDSITSVDIGDGILPSGSGNVSFSGIYAGNVIGSVVNRGEGSDVRGDIIANTSIGSVSLSSGAIIGARVAVFDTFLGGRRGFGAALPDGNEPVNNPVFEIGQIRISGNGGIIGSDIAGADLGPISVAGFGILDSRIEAAGAGTIKSINAAGYGIRGSSLEAGFLPSVSASARPKNISTLEYTASVRQSERFTIDPFFNQAPNAETDMHIYLGTSARRPQVKRVTDTGVIADSQILSGRDAGSIFASQIRASTFNISNQVSSIETRGVVDGLSLTTGHLKSYASGASSFGLNFTVAGPIDEFHVIGDLDETSSIKAVGPSGKIVDFIIDGSLNGDVSSSNSFHFLAVGKDLGATSLVKAKTLDKKQIRHNIFGTIQIG